MVEVSKPLSVEGRCRRLSIHVVIPFSVERLMKCKRDANLPWGDETNCTGSCSKAERMDPWRCANRRTRTKIHTWRSDVDSLLRVVGTYTCRIWHSDWRRWHWNTVVCWGSHLVCGPKTGFLDKGSWVITASWWCSNWSAEENWELHLLHFFGDTTSHQLYIECRMASCAKLH